MRPTPILLAATAAFLLGSVASGAQEMSSSIGLPAPAEEPAEVGPNPFEARGATLPPVMRYLQAESIPLVFVGEAGGVKGYLGESANGRNQVLYPMPDGEHVVAGLMFRSGGQQITKKQVMDMVRRFGDAAASVPDIDLAALSEIPEEIVEETGGDAEKPIMDWFRERGLKVTSLGARDGGVDAYLVEAASGTPGVAGKMQVFYEMPDKRYAIAGLMLRRGGVNVTGLQIGKLQERYLAEARAAAEAAGIEPAEASQASPQDTPAPQASAPASGAVPAPGQTDGAAPPATPFSDLNVPEPRDDDTPVIRDALTLLEGLRQQSPPVPPPAQAPATAPSGPAAPTAAVPAPVMQDIPISTAPVEAAEAFLAVDIEPERLLADANNTVFFTVGVPGAPAIYMVADPQCPFCHETWRQLRPLVFNGKVQLRIIMIAGLAGSDPIARTILSRSDPSAAWLNGQGSVRGVEVRDGPAEGSPEWLQAGNYLQINAEFLRKYAVTSTPFLAYVTGDSKVYASRGLPPDMNAFLAALK